MQGGGKKENNYPYSDQGFSVTCQLGFAIPHIPAFSLNLRADKIFMDREMADLTAGSDLLDNFVPHTMFNFIKQVI